MTIEHSHLLEHGSHQATGLTQDCLCKTSLCFKKNVCIVTKVLPLTPRHSQRHHLLNTGFFMNPKTSPRRRESFPITTGDTHSEFPKTAIKNEAPTLQGTDPLLQPLFYHLPPCKETRLREQPQGPFAGIRLSPQHLG